MNIANKQKGYHHEDHMVYSCQYHVIFCPKYRRRVLVPPINGRLKELILEKQNDYGYKVLEMEVMPDHV
ncbi:MAG: IS200/IS605 family transposase, partial [Caldisericum sp.]|uniref:IS200/IS605 family transposase n=1 Tax=Caldisericum sp. TaxID=2499687 RepID=UPI003D151ADE